MPIPLLIAVTIGGGCFFAGVNIALIQMTLKEYGFNFNLKNDTDRQTVLCLVLFIGAITSMVLYPLNDEGSQITWINILVVTLLFSVQYGLVIINHNTIFRFSAAYPENKFFQFILRHYGFLYIIPIFTMIPIYLAGYYTIPSNVTLNKHFFNMQVFKPMNIALVLITELLAVITDIRLLVRVGEVTDRTNLKNSSIQPKGFKRNWKKFQKYSRADLWRDYYVIWGLLVIDISLKIAIASGVKIIFDSAVSITTMIMRGRFNLRYTSLLKYMLENPKLKPTNVTYTVPLQHAQYERTHQSSATLPADTVGFSNVLDSFMFDESAQFGMKQFNPLDSSIGDESLKASENSLLPNK
ncbi:hypothetical protein HDV02_002517 [Globomyces sp. JEL0801]|nr:hypothetical protein HDV02_002517 [Globomyces sp. JEL0801]